MSCYRPLRLFNSKKDPCSLDKSMLNVPCGHCAGCRKARQNDWFVRAYFEFFGNKIGNKNPICFFVSLDFDEMHLPLYNNHEDRLCSDEERILYLKSKSDFDYIVPCFDSEVLTKFFQDLRQKTDLPPFRYLANCDYGGLLERPHYHVCFVFKPGSDVSKFWSCVEKYWVSGSHTNIQLINPIYEDPLRAIEYITSYSVKDLRYEIRQREISMSKRFRFRATSSIGFGAQALDPSEFNSSRLLSEGIIFNNRITVNKVLKSPFISIKISDKYVKFAIPRYYIQKLFYNSSWDPVEKKQSLVRNSLGYQLLKIRHNANYKRFYEEFKLSSSLNFTDNSVFQTILRKYDIFNTYLGVSWRDVVSDVVSKGDEFLNFLRYRDFMYFCDSKINYLYRYKPCRFVVNYKDNNVIKYHSYFLFSDFDNNVRENIIDSPNIQSFIDALFIYDIYNIIVNKERGRYEDFKLIEAEKAKQRYKISHDRKLFWHLKRNNFNFSKLTSKSYVSFNQSFEGGF